MPAEVATLYALTPFLLIAASILRYKRGLMGVSDINEKAATDGVIPLPRLWWVSFLGGSACSLQCQFAFTPDAVYPMQTGSSAEEAKQVIATESCNPAPLSSASGYAILLSFALVLVYVWSLDDLIHLPA